MISVKNALGKLINLAEHDEVVSSEIKWISDAPSESDHPYFFRVSETFQLLGMTIPRYSIGIYIPDISLGVMISIGSTGITYASKNQNGWQMIGVLK